MRMPPRFYQYPSASRDALAAANGGIDNDKKKTCKCNGARLSDHRRCRYSPAMPDDPQDFDGFKASDFDPPPHLMAPEDPAEYDAGLRASVERALADPRPRIPHEQVMAQMQAIIDRHKKR